MISMRTFGVRASLLVASLLLVSGGRVQGDEPIPTVPPTLTAKICANGEVCGTATSINPPIEITVERVGEPGELDIDTFTNGNEVSYETTGTSGDQEGQTYRVTAVDKFGNKTVRTVTR